VKKSSTPNIMMSLHFGSQSLVSSDSLGRTGRKMIAWVKTVSWYYDDLPMERV